MSSQQHAAARASDLLQRVCAAAGLYPSLVLPLARVAMAIDELRALLADGRRAPSAAQLAEAEAILSRAGEQLDELEQGNGASHCPTCQLWWAPWIHGPQVGEACPDCGRPTVVCPPRMGADNVN